MEASDPDQRAGRSGWAQAEPPKSCTVLGVKSMEFRWISSGDWRVADPTKVTWSTSARVPRPHLPPAPVGFQDSSAPSAPARCSTDRAHAPGPGQKSGVHGQSLTSLHWQCGQRAAKASQHGLDHYTYLHSKSIKPVDQYACGAMHWSARKYGKKNAN